MRTPLLQPLGFADRDEKPASTATAAATSRPFSDTMHSMDTSGSSGSAPNSSSSDKRRYKSTNETSDQATKRGLKRPRKRGPPEFKVRHDYHDYSNTSYDDFMQSHPHRKRARELKYHPPFPCCLHAVLKSVDLSAQDDVISWCCHGRAFIVHNPGEFSQRIMPFFFRQTKFSSFQRQLNIYDFKRLTKGPDAGAYYNELFLRGREDLCPAMNRQKIKGTRHKGANNPDEEPDFYSMPPLDPTRMAQPGSFSSGCVGPADALPSLRSSPAVVTPTCSERNSKILSTTVADDLLQSILAEGSASTLPFPQQVDAKSSAKKMVGGPIYSRDSDVIEAVDLSDVCADELEDNFFPPFASRSQIKGSAASSKSAVETGSGVTTPFLPDDYYEMFSSDEEVMLKADESFHEIIW